MCVQGLPDHGTAIHARIMIKIGLKPFCLVAGFSLSLSPVCVCLPAFVEIVGAFATTPPPPPPPSPPPPTHTEGTRSKGRIGMEARGRHGGGRRRGG